jgi:hypothetical protein
VPRRKAAGPATDKVNGPHAVSQAGEPRDREATPSDSAFQGMVVYYSGQACIGFFPNLKTAAGAINAKAAS